MKKLPITQQDAHTELLNGLLWTAADRALYYICSKEFSGMSKAGIEWHMDGSASRIKQGEAAVQKVVTTVENCLEYRRTRQGHMWE